jgi:hypothetical protein
MTRLLSIAMLLLISTFTFAQTKGWVNLFNGKNLDGWKVLNGTAEYTISNGEIIGTSKVGSPNTFLATEKIYGDFILEYEMKMEKGLNSGVQIRSLSNPDVKDGRVHGYQVECDDSKRAWSAGIYDEARRGWLYPMEYNQPAKSAFKSGEWNKYRVEAVGNSIRTWLNGIPCANLVDDMTSEGFIALQVHGIGNNASNAGKTISWKNIRIKTENLKSERKPMDKNVQEVSYLNNKLTESEKSNGWKLLWDGNTSNGWRSVKEEKFPEKGWTMENGELIVNKEGNKSGGDIATIVPFKNFILEIDFLYTPGANSGIKYFIQKGADGIISSLGCEYQVLDDEKHPDAKMGVNGNRTISSLYDLIPANSQIFDPAQPVKRNNGPNQWNRARIEVRGNNVTHYLNGVKTVEYTRGTQMWKALVAYSKFSKHAGFGEFETGHILLQDHGDEVHYRNMKIKEL